MESAPTNKNILVVYLKKDEQLFNLCSLYIKTFAIYLAIIATILKFAYDSASTIDIRNVLNIFGTSMSFLGVFVCILGEVLRRELRSDLEKLAELLELPQNKSNYLLLKFTVISAFTFVVFSLIAWFYLLLIL